MPSSLIEKAVKLTAKNRHAWRVEETRKAGNLVEILLDLIGVGGTAGVEGLGTERYPSFQKLGSGRKQAGDGAAWMAAAEEIVLGWATRGEIKVVIEDSKILGVTEDTVEEWGASISAENIRWVKALAVRAALGPVKIRGYEIDVIIIGTEELYKCISSLTTSE